MILSSFLGIFVINNIIATELQIIISIFAVEKKKELTIRSYSKKRTRLKQGKIYEIIRT